MAYVAENAKFIKAYNDYLQTNNITQANATIYGRLNGEVFPIDYDMFFNFLLNKVIMGVISQHTFNDPLEQLYKANVNVGSVIEDKRTILIGEEKDYSLKNFETDVINPFIKEKRGISVVYHKVTEHKKIKVTVSEAQVQEAVLNEGGISSLMNALINDLGVESSAWSYKDKRKCLSKDDFVTIVPIKDYEDFSIKVKNTVVDMKHFDNSYKYNASLLYSPLSIDDIVIIMSEKYRNEVDVKYFTGLFNVAFAKIEEKILYIDEFTGNPDIVCGIYDKRGLQFRKTLDTTRPTVNNEDLTVNYVYHLWRMHSVSPHYNAVLFVRDNGTIENAENKIINETEKPYKRTFEKAVIYTLDGTTPTKTNGTKVTAGTEIEITENKVLKTVTLNGENIIPNSLRISRYRFV